MAFSSSWTASVGDDDLAFIKRSVASASRPASLGPGRRESNGGGVSGREQVILFMQDLQVQVKKKRDWRSSWRIGVVVVMSM